MNRIVLITLFVISSLFGEIIDRGARLDKNSVNSLSTIMESIQRQSGVRTVIIVLGEDESDQIARLTSSYAIELNVEGDEKWVLGVISPNGSVRISTSEALSTWFSEAHMKSFISGTGSQILHKGLPIASEFLLLNIADVISQKENMELSDLLTKVEKESGTSPSFIVWIAVILLLLIVSTSFKFVRNKKKNEPEAREVPYFGSSYQRGKQMLFGASFHNGIKR